ncbi:MAG: riboflavin biosynthesis protein RibF [Alphaproteobacteria bacterium]|nr:riboflavin biosynthesis protein RibF [Alphaproteobacteria bacterium]
MTDEQNPLMDYLTKRPVRTGGVLALGNFDGVHLGHCKIIAAAHKEAKRLKCEAHALTFDPHPYAMFHKEGGPFLLTPPSMKNRLLIEAGADHVTTIHFTKAFADKTPDAFIHDVLIEGCAVKHVVVGFDFVFGHGRGGNREGLRRCLEPQGIGVTEVPPFRDETGEVISSSRIRAALRHGNVDQARALLGRPFSIEGEIQSGDQMGRTIDFPTANIELGEIVRPLYGVYAIYARAVATTQWYAGVANIGVRPSASTHNELLEFHLFDFDRSLYGDAWEVQLCHYLRPEKAFPTMVALKQQIQADVGEARRLFALTAHHDNNG